MYSKKPQPSDTGVALVIVLAFMVLVTGLVVAYFSRSILDRQISNSSASQTKVELFAQGAVETTIADLKQEIVAGSSNVGTSAHPVYLPLAAANAVPSLVGSTGTNGLENLLKTSGSALFHAGTAPTTGTSINGRYMTAARWNKPLLLPVTGTNDYTPKLANGAAFTPPNWILVARDGSNPQAASKDVVGRYAYAIYNEGGLLDANVAGFPIGSGSAAVLSGAAYKPAIAYADLKQIDPQFTDSKIDQLVAWRNWATTQAPGSSFTNPGFTAVSGSNYYQSILSNTTGFLAAGTALYNSQTDRMFVSRQQLISFLQNGLGLSVTGPAYQCLSTFSRSLNQPSLAPDFDNASLPSYRQKIVDAGGFDVAGKAGNDSYGLESTINPKFLTIRAQTPFKRNDGTTAVVGEPLVKKRFALNQLAWVTYRGPSATVASGDPVISAYLQAGLSQAFLNRGTSETTGNVYKYFGLTWSGGSTIGGHWTYDHGIKSSAGVVIIGSLADARDQDREPDFFELLKAGINVGSVGKADTTDGFSNTTAEKAGITVDNTADFQILQIGANMIDQFDPDGYPTQLWIKDKTNSGISVDQKLFGKENLPYLNGMHSCMTSIVTSSSNDVLMLVEIPSIWNPVDVASSFPTPGILAPQQLRATLVSSDPWNTVTPSSNKINFIATYTSGVTDPAVITPVTASTYWSSRDATAITFTNALTDDNGLPLYREPTLLGQKNMPMGSNMDFGPLYNVSASVASGATVTVTPGSPITEKDSGTKFLGWPDGGASIVSGSLQLQTYVTTTGTHSNPCNRGSLPAGRTIRMEWYDGSAWQPYQEYYWDLAGPVYEFPGTPACYPVFEQWRDQDPVSVSYVHRTSEVAWDTRSSRFSPVRCQTALLMTRYPYQIATIRGSNTAGWTKSKDYCFVEGYCSNYDCPTPGAGWGNTTYFVYPGMSEQNNPVALFKNRGSSIGSQYYTDPDGVARRAMAAYVPTGGINATATVTTGLPLATGSNGSSGPASSRPIMLNRPFRNVGELGCVFRDTPWKNLDFFTPESGDSGLLDVFCIAADDTPDGVVAGKVDLNTKQVPVLQAILSGALQDEINTASPLLAPLDTSNSLNIAKALVARTSNTTAVMSGVGPLTNLSDLVGRYTSSTNPFGQHYDGFSADPALGSLDGSGLPSSTAPKDIIQRFREAPIRALAQVGDVRTWNLMIDVVAQTGRYPQNATGIDKFMVEGEKRYWVHVAIDRATGQVVDKQIEEVKE